MKHLSLVFFLWVSIYTHAQMDTIKWNRLSSPPQSLSNAESAYFLIDSDFFVAGGWINQPGGILSNTVWKYHIPSNSWHQMKNLPFGASASSASFVLNGSGFFLTVTDSASNGRCDTILWKYYSQVDSWSRQASFPAMARQNSSFFQYDNKGYVGQTDGCIASDNDFWMYDPDFNRWSQVASLPVNITGGSVATVASNSYAYLFGGLGTNEVWRYNILLSTWDSIGLMPGLPRAYAVFWSLDSFIIGGAGTQSDTSSNLYQISDYYIFSLQDNLWKPILFENFTDSAALGYAFIWEKRAYYFGGATDPYGSTNNISIWSADVSKYVHDTTTGIVNTNPEPSFTVYPNPSHSPSFSISTSEGGHVIFSDALGRVIDERRLKQGVNQIRLTTDDEVVFYHATLQYGTTANGKVVFLR